MGTIYSSLTDTELTALLNVKNQEAYAEIYNRYAPKVYSQVNQMLRNEDAAKDVVQELFIAIWNKADHISAKGNLGGYLYVAAQNSVLKIIRKGRLEIDYLESLSELANEIEDEQGSDYDVEILYTMIKQEIANLPDKMRTIFEMSRKGDLSYREIALELGISENTVRKQVSNALKIVRLNVGKPASLGFILALLTHR